MKFAFTILIFCFFVFCVNAQRGGGTCSKKPIIEELEDLNTIKKKCAIGDKASHPKSHKKKFKSGRKLSIKEVLFSVVEKSPSFPKCKSTPVVNKKKCFRRQLKKHFTKNFYTEKISDLGIEGKIFVRFTIDIYGKIKKISVKSNKKSKVLKKEVIRVISKLPPMTPGKHKKIPVNVRYSFPINLALN